MMKSLMSTNLPIPKYRHCSPKKKPVLSTNTSNSNILSKTQKKPKRHSSQPSTKAKLRCRTQANSPTKQSITSINIDKSKFTYIENPDIDNELIELYKKYSETKNNRQKTETDYTQLTNKYQLLQKEESKLKVKENMILKHQEKAQMVQFKNLEEKEKLFHAKMKLKEKITEIKNQNDKFRQERDNYLKHWRDSKADINNNIITKIKKERKTDYQKYLQKQQEEYNRKKEKIKEIKEHRAISAEMRKQEEYERKLKMKTDLIKKIMLEENKKKQLEEASSKIQSDTIDLIGKIKDFTKTLTEETQGRSNNNSKSDKENN